MPKKRSVSPSFRHFCKLAQMMLDGFMVMGMTVLFMMFGVMSMLFMMFLMHSYFPFFDCLRLFQYFFLD